MADLLTAEVRSGFAAASRASRSSVSRYILESPRSAGMRESRSGITLMPDGACQAAQEAANGLMEGGKFALTVNPFLRRTWEHTTQAGRGGKQGGDNERGEVLYRSGD